MRTIYTAKIVTTNWWDRLLLKMSSIFAKLEKTEINKTLKIRKKHCGWNTNTYDILKKFAANMSVYENHVVHNKADTVAFRRLLYNEYIQRMESVNPKTKRVKYLYSITPKGFKEYKELEEQ